jgi:hypothetical protein
MYLAPSVLRTLFHINLDVVRSAVSVDNLPGVVDEIPSSCDLNMVRVHFLWTEIDNDTSIRDSLIFGGTFDFIVSHDKNRVSVFLSCFIVALSHATKVFTKRGLPYL